MRFAAAPLLAIVFVLVITAPPAVATGGEGETWPTFTESSGCGAQRMSTPTNHYSGWLSTKAILRGEYGGMFGRTVQAVLDDMVKWRIPGSSEFLAVHPRLLPALELVERSLADEIDDGNRYRITDKWTYSAAARTIAGGTRISRHTYGTAFDVNAHRNPYSRSNDLRSDIPDWWLDSFIDAGFCWGGHWIGVKDTMHFSWQGPAFSGETSLAPFYAPLTEPIAFADRAVSVPVEPQNTNGLLTTVLTDAATNGAVDVVRVRRDGDAVIVDASVASLRHSACSLRSSIVSRIGQDAADAHTIGFGDWDGRGGNDLWLVSDVNGHVELSVRWTFGGFSAETSALTSVPAPAVDAWITSADYDVDGELDLFIVEDGTLTIWAIDPDTGASSPLFEGAIPFPDAEHFTLGDTDLDHVPDLWAVGGGEVLVALGTNEYATVAERHQPSLLPTRIVDVVASDYDGDGRDDLIIFDGSSKHVWLGNTRLADGLPLEVWFENPEATCDQPPRTFDVDVPQLSTSGWVAEGSYEWRKKQGLTTGCDPEEEGCRAPIVTHGSFAEFLAWILDVDAVAGDGALAAPRTLVKAGYEIPCSLFDQDCWESPMLRTEFAVRFGQFLAERRGDVPEPHRWIQSHPDIAWPIAEPH